jgi:hypothetical protein
LPPVATPLPTRVPSLKIFTVLPASAVPVKVGVVMLVRSSLLDDPESLAEDRSGVEGAAGEVVSIVTDKADDATDVFPAASVALAVIELTPSGSALTAIVQLPLPSAVPVPINVEPARKSFTTAFASAVPLNVGVVLLVMLSVFDVPVSDAAARSGVEGADGAVVSTVIDKADDATDTFPAASVALAVME